MTAASIDYAAIAPPLLVAVLAAALLVADLVTPQVRPLLPLAALAGLLAALVCITLLARGEDRGSFCNATGCAYSTDRFTLVFQALFCVAGIVVVLLCMPVVAGESLPAGEFWFLLLTSFAGMLTLAAGRDFVVLLLALEVVSVPAFVLVGLRRDDPRAAEAALKFFLFSVISTAITVYGMSLVYGLTGSLQVDRIAAATVPGDQLPLLLGAGGLVVAGFAFKVSAVPFHFWAPDTYAGSPVPVAAFLSVASKAAGFAGLVVVLHAVGGGGDRFRPVLSVLAALTMTVGNLAALRQRDVVRLLAWSSVAQAGYMLVPLATDHPDAMPVYVAAYAAMNLGAFGCAAAVAHSRPRQSVEDYRGLVASTPWLALAFAFFLTALAGLPPGILGLVAKVVVFRAAVTGGATWLAVVMAVNTVVALYYYARLAATLFDTGGTTETPRRLPVPAPTVAAVMISGVVAVVLGFWPQALLVAVPSFS